MVTYVINTSENKTFDTEVLFDLAGYTKIKWMHCTLDQINTCAEAIYEKQNVLGAEQFRIAVIVDFYNFDRIRVPYGRRGFGREVGVDMSLYMPYIEIYLLDRLIGYLEKRDMLTFDFEVYYVQNEKSERYEFLKSAETQVRQILGGKDLAFSKTVSVEKVEEKVIPAEGMPPLNEMELTEYEEPKKIIVEEERDYYKSFTLYCTNETSIDFYLSDYPYGTEEMTFEEFYDAFRRRISGKNEVRRHYYISSYGGGVSRAAFDTLSLSLYLIRMYEREEMAFAEGEMEIIHLDATILKDVLEEAWCKINVARDVAKKNNLQYYSLYQNQTTYKEDEEDKISIPDAIIKERVTLPKEITDEKLSCEQYYSEICAFASRSAAEVKERNRQEFDSIMSEYLKQRDDTRENNIEAEFDSLKNLGLLKTTERSPSYNDYENIVSQKQKEISMVFKKILDAEYIAVNYSEDKKKADDAYLEYKKYKSWTHRNIIGDIIFMVLAVAAMIIPYYLLQLTTYNSQFFGSFMLCLITSGLFAGLFVCSVVFQLLPLLGKLKKAKQKLRDCYLDCCAKERYSFSSIRRRYQKDLIYIEQARYELRQIKRLYDANHSKNLNVRAHREMLEIFADCISAMLNNLDVEPHFDPEETVEGEFDLGKPIRSKENKIYQIFSIEVIEKMFPKKKGSDEQ